MDWNPSLVIHKNVYMIHVNVLVRSRNNDSYVLGNLIKTLMTHIDLFRVKTNTGIANMYFYN